MTQAVKAAIVTVGLDLEADSLLIRRSCTLPQASIGLQFGSFDSKMGKLTTVLLQQGKRTIL